GGTFLAGRSAVGSAGIWHWSGREWKLDLDLLKTTLGALGQNRFDVAQPEIRNNSAFVAVPTPEIERIEIDGKGSSVAWATRDGAVLWSPLTANAPASVVYDAKVVGLSNVADLSISRNGRFLVVGDADHAILLFDLEMASQNRTTK